MTKSEKTMLDTNDQFPVMSLKTAKHNEVQIDGNFSREYGVVLVYRGHW